jgi:hypothetical protein
VRTIEDPTLRYQDEAGDWDAALPALRAIGVKVLAELTGMSERTLRSRLWEGRVPHPEERRELIRLVAELSRARPTHREGPTE